MGKHVTGNDMIELFNRINRCLPINMVNTARRAVICKGTTGTDIFNLDRLKP